MGLMGLRTILWAMKTTPIHELEKVVLLLAWAGLLNVGVCVVVVVGGGGGGGYSLLLMLRST